MTNTNLIGQICDSPILNVSFFLKIIFILAEIGKYIY